MTAGNANYPVLVGDTWHFFDMKTEEAWIKWLINEVDKEAGTVAMTKLDGRNPGFKAKGYDLAKMTAPRWKWLSGKAVPDVLFPCPECDEDKPINEGDFICMDCREKADS